MNVLFVCHRFPYPPKRGGKIRPFQMIRHLSEQGHRVVVASLARSADEAEEGQGLTPYCAEFDMVQVNETVQNMRTVGCVVTTSPSSMGYFYSPELARRIGARLEAQRFDLIIVHCSSVARYVEHAKGVPRILDFGDMDSQKWLAYSHHKPFPVSTGYWLEGTKLEREERRLSRVFEICTVTTKAELETLNGFDSGTPTGWFPNGVDAEYFTPTGEPYDPDTISFIGRMDYYPNEACMTDFCQQTLPLLRQRRPGIRLLIVGADPSPAVMRLGDIPGVTVTGSVPDVRPYVRQSALTVSTLSIARGVQNKILESMALGVPVVTSPTAAGGVDANDGEHFLVASSPQGVADAILRIARDPVERDRLSRAGRERMLSHHSWKGSMERLDRIVAGCLEAGARLVRS
jgi:sugar transferase (PEP-CTERM/EpsH1 system associated)